jgi:hypothetical protein
MLLKTHPYLALKFQKDLLYVCGFKTVVQHENKLNERARNGPNLV